MTSYCCRRYVSRLFQTFGKPQPKPKSERKEHELGLSCKSHKLMLYNDIIAPSHSGGFHLLPLGLRALEKLTRLVDQEMEAIGGQKVALTTLAPEALWHQSGRWVSAGAELFTLKDRHKHQYCLGPTHEELVTKLMANMTHISYKHLPIRLYQITRKFRDEMAPKYGLLRGREFEMKDMYTFDTCEKTALETYNTVCGAYERIFDRIGVEYVKVSGATGIIGGDLSHEFHYLTDVGQDSLLTCHRCGVEMNKELAEEDGSLPGVCQLPGSECQLLERRGIEVGHTFYLGTKYSSVFNACYRAQDGSSMVEYEMGCYGLGMTRILQASLESLSTDASLRWPRLLAPYQLCIIPKKDRTHGEEYLRLAESLSDQLTSHPHLRSEVIIDDRMSLTIGRRQVDADRLGCPYTLVLAGKALESSPQYEVIDNYTGETSFLSWEQLSDFVDKIVTV
ncbi:probable proline--tRNA ligase, mitochondrial [Aplysia californica]|uniref:proline--tRNA ligase n=1 Tax=Aplysia californica TaxID=6500 RepID=A0ABM1A6N9_APLCA|nr:probable proline--tRNA ligase, mitochondrial [Aplysia californica]